MAENESKIHVLDAAYRPFPSFREWISKVSIDSSRWNRYSESLKSTGESSAKAFQRAREIVKRAAALDTGAIEGLYEVDRGFTYTVAFETAAWELELDKKGENVRPLFEAQLHAYDYVLDLATKAEPVSEAAIRVLHEVVCKAQLTYRVMTAVGPQDQELIKGRYKVLPNHVRTRDGIDHSYAPVDAAPAEMQRLLEEMRTADFLAAHPILQSSYAHYGLVVIHPFADGNGRVARALASAFTYRAISIPIMILSEHKSDYLDTLEKADQGEYKPFVDFMLARSLDTITLARESMLTEESLAPGEGAEAIEKLYITKGGYTQDQVEKAANQLLTLIQYTAEKAILQLAGPNLRGGSTKLRNIPGSPGPAHRFSVGEEKGWSLQFETLPPARALVYRHFVLWVPKDAGGEDDFQIVFVLKGSHQDNMSVAPIVEFSARMDELAGSASGVLQIRLGIFVDRIIGNMLRDLKQLAEKSLSA